MKFRRSRIESQYRADYAWTTTPRHVRRQGGFRAHDLESMRVESPDPARCCDTTPLPLPCPPMWSEDDFQYAVENTEVILAPAQQIATFGSTSFRFYLISE